MKETIYAAAVAVASLLSACAVTEPSTIDDVHTGVRAGISREFVASKNMAATVHVQAMAGTASGQPGYLLKVRRNASFSKNAFFHSAYSYGQQLPYSYGGAKILHCQVIGCDVMEWGSVTLTPALFQRGLQQGLELRLFGRGDNTLLQVPAEAFRQAVAVAPR